MHFGGWRSQNSPKHPPGRGVFQGGWDGEGLAHTPRLVKTADPPRRMENGLGHGIPPEGPMATPLVTPPLWRVSRSVRDDDMHTLLVCVVICRCVWVPPFGGLLWGLVDHGSPGHSRESDHNPVFGAATAALTPWPRRAGKHNAHKKRMHIVVNGPQNRNRRKPDAGSPFRGPSLCTHKLENLPSADSTDERAYLRFTQGDAQGPKGFSKASRVPRGSPGPPGSQGVLQGRYPPVPKTKKNMPRRAHPLRP